MISQDTIMSYTNTHIHDYSLSWLGTDTSIKSDGVKLVVYAQTSRLSEIVQSCKCFPHMSRIPAFT